MAKTTKPKKKLSETPAKKPSGKGTQKDWTRHGKTNLYTSVKNGERIFLTKKQWEKLPK